MQFHTKLTDANPKYSFISEPSTGYVYYKHQMNPSID